VALGLRFALLGLCQLLLGSDLLLAKLVLGFAVALFIAALPLKRVGSG